MYPWTDGENNYINYLLMYNKNQPNVGTFQGTNIYRLGCIPFGEKENDLQTFRCQLPPYSFVTLFAWESKGEDASTKILVAATAVPHSLQLELGVFGPSP